MNDKLSEEFENMTLMEVSIQWSLFNFWSVGSNPVALVLRPLLDMAKDTS